ncbi:PC4 and SFRS1-interacting protein-like [Haliotis rufescens]|uniref:PC4 and SFRS1-interacting protein-like n=1 Tax=Haliotis rufescens TaxID=6454 RepID=UPI00201EA0F2|nr:PC4 and SFRS1-interacting protein-like [Haliotis rufescens]XP_046375769.2 PC4 and SFRS1-interacting protein-like [Haliotis rufescens]XP_046375770.2 PC4 and SFRS1-interacting protein-like [Haliotis rufescens]
MDTGKKKQAKHSFSVPSVKSNVVPDKEKKPSCLDAKQKSCKKVDKQPRTADNIELKQKEQKKPIPVGDGNVREPRKVYGKSLTNEEYDDIFMAVLQSVSRAETRGEVSDNSDDEGNLMNEESDKDETSSQVIEVIVKVEEMEDQKHFVNMEDEDIDKWDNKKALSKHKENKYNVEKTMPPEKKLMIPDSTVKETTTALAFSTKSAKPKKEKQATKRKDICSVADTVYPPSTSDTKKRKETSLLPKKIGKEMKKESKKTAALPNRDVKVKKVKSEEKTSLKKKMSERELEDVGTWVQCVNSYCLKWRFLQNISDPLEIPDRWECRMNTVEAFNNCEKPEEMYDESEHIFTKYTEGSVVLAKMDGYPWWPAMIEIDPDYGTFYEVDEPTSMCPTKYHVVFFDKKVSRAWINISSIKPYSEIDSLPRKCKGHDYTREVKIAIENANAALEHTLKDRLKKYSFSSRFSGKWGYFQSNTDQDNTKEERSKSKVSRCSKKRKIDQEDNLVDDETLNQILNNSQSVLSDVAGMLDSMENDDFNNNADSDFLVSKPKKTVKEIKIEEEYRDLQVSDVKCGDSESMKEAAKFEVTKLDMDIFTMELGSVQLESQDQQNTEVLGDDCCSTDANVAVPDSVTNGNVDETEAPEVPDKTSAGMEKTTQKKKKAESEKERDKKQNKPNKQTKKACKENDVCVKEEITKKKRKKKNKGGDTANEYPEVNLEKSKNKTQKVLEKKIGETAGESNISKLGEDNDVEGETLHKVKGMKTDKSVNSSGEDDGKIKSLDTGMGGNNKVKKMMKVSNDKQAGNVPEINTENKQRQNMEMKSKSGEDKKTKKKKSKFMNPLHAAKEKVCKNSSSDKRSGDKEEKTQDNKCMKDVSCENKSFKPSSQSSQKQQVLNKETEKYDHYESDDEMDLDLDIPVKPSVDKVDSDDDFMLDVQHTPIHKSAVVAQEEDSDPLDFEE